MPGAAQASAVQHVQTGQQSLSGQVSSDHKFFLCVFSFAFVEFESTDDAKEALENLNNTDIEGRSIRLEYSQQNTRGNDGGRGNSGRTLWQFDSI